MRQHQDLKIIPVADNLKTESLKLHIYIYITALYQLGLLGSFPGHPSPMGHPIECLPRFHLLWERDWGSQCTRQWWVWLKYVHHIKGRFLKGVMQWGVVSEDNLCRDWSHPLWSPMWGNRCLALFWESGPSAPPAH